MFAPLTEPIARLSETFRQHAPEAVALLRRYVEARELEADSLAVIARAVVGEEATFTLTRRTSNHGE